MKLNSLTVKNFRGFSELPVSFHDHLTVLVGINGAGKTSILDAIAISLGTVFTAFDGLTGIKIKKQDASIKAYKVGSGDDVQGQYPVVICANGALGSEDVAWERSLNRDSGSTTIKNASKLISIAKSYQERLRNGDTTLSLPIIAYYGTGRLWDYHREKKNNAFKNDSRLNGYVDALDGTANIKLMLNWFRKKAIEKQENQELGMGPIPELEAVYHAMEECYSLATGETDVRIRYSVSTNELNVYYAAKDGTRVRLPLNQLSDGFKSTLSLVADIAYRAAVLNPQLSDRVTKESDGIILIDEVDLHLHPSWQRRVLNDLQTIFPKMQFIVSTHAPAVIQSISREHLRILRDNRLEMPSLQTFGKDVNGIFRSVMDVSERPIEIKMRFNSLYELLDNEQYDDAEQMLNQLEDEIGSDDPEIVACRVQLDLERR